MLDVDSRDAQTRASSEVSRYGLPVRRQWLIVIGMAVSIAAVLAVSWIWGQKNGAGASESHRGEQQTADGALHLTPTQLASIAARPVALMNFRTERVTDGKIAVNGDKTTPVFSPYSGRVSKVFANLGDHVKQGQPLLAVDAAEFVQGQSDLVSAVNALNTAHAQVDMAQINEQRKHALYDAKGASLQDWQQSRSDLVAAQSNLRSAEAIAALARNKLRIQGKSESDIAALEKPQAMGVTSMVVAPISGTVTDRQVGLGQYIQAGASTPVYAIGDLSTLWLIGNVREADASSVQRGQPVEVRVLALPGRVFSARISFIAPTLDAATRRLSVRAVVENPEGLLKPEMFANFSIVTSGESKAPAVPQSSIVYEGDTARVWILAGADTVVSRQVRTGRIRDGMVEVTEGVSAGDVVVTHGTLFIDRAARSG